LHILIFIFIYVGYPSLRPVACWDCGFEYRQEHGCVSLVRVVCCNVEVPATSRLLVQRSPTEFGALLCVI